METQAFSSNDHRPGLRERKKARQRQEIIEAAIALFRESGFENTRVSDIVDACEISEPTFFRYFSCKEVLLEEVTARVMMGVVEGAGERRAHETVRDSLTRRYMCWAEIIGNDRPLAIAVCSGLKPQRLGSDHAHSLLADVVAAQSTGEISTDHDPAELAGILGGSLGATLATWAVGSDTPFDLRKRLEKTVDIFFRGTR